MELEFNRRYGATFKSGPTIKAPQSKRALAEILTSRNPMGHALSAQTSNHAPPQSRNDRKCVPPSGHDMAPITFTCFDFI